MKNKEEEPRVGKAGEHQVSETPPDLSLDTKTQDWRLRKRWQGQGQNKQGDCPPVSPVWTHSSAQVVGVHAQLGTGSHLKF